MGLIGQQCQQECDFYHLSIFAPPSSCEKCNQCESLQCCESDIKSYSRCNPMCTIACQRLYQRLKHLPKCPSGCSCTECYQECMITPKRREVIKPCDVIKFQCGPPHYNTIYRKSYDLPTTNLPLY